MKQGRSLAGPFLVVGYGGERPGQVAKAVQNVIPSSWGGRRTLPYAFTEQGVAMLSSVLRSRRATQVNVEIMRAFVRLREILAGHADLVRRIDSLERCYDKQFKVVFEAIRALISEESSPNSRIGFRTTPKKPKR